MQLKKYLKEQVENCDDLILWVDSALVDETKLKYTHNLRLILDHTKRLKINFKEIIKEEEKNHE